jgi:hypothetical protein
LRAFVNGEKTNWRGLEDHVERDAESNILTNRKREHTLTKVKPLRQVPRRATLKTSLLLIHLRYQASRREVQL